MVETVSSILKRKYRGSLKSSNYRLQVKVIKMKVILHNLSRAMNSFSFLVIIEEYYKDIG